MAILMTDDIETQARETRIKKLQYRANHRGIKEMDIVIGGFANECLADLSDAEIDDFEVLMSEHDRDLIIWVTGEEEFPHADLMPMFKRVCAHATKVFEEKTS